MSELKKCPFCGVIPIVLKRDGATAIKCNNGAECWICPQTSFYSQKETAIEAWNDRADVAPVVRGNTNADRIRVMDINEMADEIAYVFFHDDYVGMGIKIADWLQQPAETEG